MLRGAMMICALLAPGLGWPTIAADLYTFSGAGLVDCYDGDTCRFDLHDRHPALGRVTFHARAVRLAGLDAPELRGAKCAAERALAERARARLLELLGAAREITVRVLIGEDKFGRMIARVLADGRDVSEVLITEGLARRWAGRREGWCG